MMRNNLGRAFSIGSIAYLSAFSLFALLLGWLNPSLGEVGNLLLLSIYCCALIPLSILSSIWLVWRNRRLLSKTFVWTAFQFTFIFLMTANTLLPILGLFFSSFQVLLFSLLGLVNFLYAHQNGYSLRFIAWGSVGYIWFILIAWRIKGNLFDLFISSIGGTSNDQGWFYAFFYGFMFIVLSGIVAFALETFQILRKEFFRN